MAPPPASAGDSAAQQTLVELAAVKGQLSSLITLMTANHAATQQRMNDLQASNDRRFQALEQQLGTVIANERATALRTVGLGSAGGGVAGAIAAAALKMFNLPGGGG